LSGAGSTFNVTNNNNINYNYGSNITAISNDGPVPTFHDLDKKKKNGGSGGGGSSSTGNAALGGIGSALAGVGNSKIWLGQSVSSAVAGSTYLASASDSI
jgi:hypothetical protein